MYNNRVRNILKNNKSNYHLKKNINVLKGTSNSNIEAGSNFNEYILKLIINYEKTVAYKLSILILGPTHYDLGIALADHGHKVTFMTWDIDDYNKLKELIKTSAFDSNINNQIINLKDFDKLNGENYDILLSLIPMYRLLTDLNFDRQRVFFEYVFKNIESALWLLPKNDSRNSLNIYLPSLKDLDFYKSYDYVIESAKVRVDFNSAEYPLIYTSKILLLINSRFYNRDLAKTIRNASSIFSRVYSIKNKLYKISVTNNNSESSVEKEFKFLTNLSLIVKIQLRIPRKIVYNKGLTFDLLQRKKIKGIDLHKIETIQDSHKILKDFVRLCRKFSKARIYHNDLRPWNVLWNGKKCVFIDFENSERYDHDVSNYPQILFFFAMANYIMRSDQSKIWDIEDIIRQNTEYLYSNRYQKLIFTSWEKISIIGLNELLTIDYCDVKKGFKQLIELVESY